MPITGTIPTELFQMKPFWGLSLRNLNVTGTLPTEIGFCNLNDLELYGLDISGTLPSQLGRLQNLLKLTIGHLPFLTTDCWTLPDSWHMDGYNCDIYLSFECQCNLPANCNKIQCHHPKMMLQSWIMFGVAMFVVFAVLVGIFIFKSSSLPGVPSGVLFSHVWREINILEKLFYLLALLASLAVVGVMGATKSGLMPLVGQEIGSMVVGGVAIVAALFVGVSVVVRVKGLAPDLVSVVNEKLDFSSANH
eukprot:TRINITY_DN3102_c0_g1_i7.p2 TRINITY_DN3102_c0_g1~~TRINITY_DN3102_c0_g1_i7.p2  ORF type:complete len:249 (-),score=27.78 TRINITY_DN3102_c0_g1_i7:229-975(-)